MIFIYDDLKAIDIHYLDFKKVFDTVPFARLLTKMRGLGVLGKVAEWIKHVLREATTMVSPPFGNTIGEPRSKAGFSNDQSSAHSSFLST